MIIKMFAITGCLLMLAIVAVNTEVLSKCQSKFKADIYFLSDASGSIHWRGWEKSLNFVADMADEFPFGPDKVRFAFGIFSNNFVRVLDLNSFTNKDQYKAKVRSTVQLKQATHTYTALNAINDLSLLTSTKLGARKNVPKVIILITDGQSQSEAQTIAAAEKLRKSGVTIFSIGVGVANVAELVAISGSAGNVFNVHSFTHLHTVGSQISQKVCEAYSVPTAKPKPKPKPAKPKSKPATAKPLQTSGTTQPTSKPVQECQPNAVIDLFSVVDASGSVPKHLYKNNFHFLEELISGFTLSETGTQFSLVTFSKNVEPRFGLSSNKSFIQQMMSNVPQSRGGTNTFKALNYIHTNELSTPRPEARLAATKVIVVITDGVSNDNVSTLEAGAQLKQQGFLIIVLAVGKDVNLHETEALASRPEYSFAVPDYHSLNYTASDIADLICSFALIHPAPSCPAQLKNDIVLIVDVGSNIESSDYDLIRTFLAQFLTGFNVNEDSTKVGLLVYGSSTQVLSNLTSPTDIVFQYLAEITPNPGLRNTHYGLSSAYHLFKPKYGGREEANKTIILLTNGNSSRPLETMATAQDTKAAGINIFTIGLTRPGSQNVNLNKVATKPEWNIKVKNSNDLINVANSLSGLVCYAKPLPKPVNKCSAAEIIDIFAVVDASGSVTRSLYRYNFQFLNKLISGFTLSEIGTKFSLVAFATKVWPQFDLSSNKTFVEEKMTNVKYYKSKTNTHLALNYLVESGINTPERGARPDAKKVAIVITDGESDFPQQTLKAAAQLRKQGFLIMVLAVGKSIDLTETEAIASSPEYSFRVDDYNSLDYTASEIAHLTCGNGLLAGE